MKVSYWAHAPHQDSGELSVPLSIAFLPRDPEEESTGSYGWLVKGVPQGPNTRTLPGLCLCLGGYAGFLQAC